MICAIMQPTVWPWAGGFDLLDQVDVLVHYDDVQVVKRSWDVRNRIKTTDGELFLTVPVKKTGHRGDTRFTNALLDDSRPWRVQHLKSVASSYKKAPFFDEVFEFIEPLIMAEVSFLGDFNVSCISAVADKLGIRTHMVRASTLPAVNGRKDARLVAICRQLHADTYLSPLGAREYIEVETAGGAFHDSGVELCYQNYSPVPYRQLHGAFLSHMCILDLLFNEGFGNSLSIIRSGRKPRLSSAAVRGADAP